MNNYLQQQTFLPPQIFKKPSLQLGLIVVIPACREAYLLLALMRLQRCQLPLCDVEVIVVLNDSQTDAPAVYEQHEQQYAEITKWKNQLTSHRLTFHVVYPDALPRKVAGVGLARKIGMDEACWRFEKIGNRDGIIVCFDADCRCEDNYLIEIEKHFKNKPDSPAAAVYFEHPLQGANLSDANYAAIVKYELHLRYFINAQRWAGFPFAYHTVGSAMAVRCKDYQKQGGMNRRKAGEDFYFLHKFIELGNFSEINTTKVIPSPRISDRVPFGTGKAIQDILNGETWHTYHPHCFRDLKKFFKQLPEIYTDVSFAEELPESIAAFLKSVDFEKKLAEIKNHTSDYTTFQKRFFRWFNAFMLMKYAHFARDNFYESTPVGVAANWLLEQTGQQKNCSRLREQLMTFRRLDRDNFFNY